MRINTLPYVLLFVLCSLSGYTQNLTGVWTGKISRSLRDMRGIESIEIQLYQQGKQLSGYAFAFKDTSRFVLYRVNGKRFRKTKEVILEEVGNPNYDLPANFYPCRKSYVMRYHRVGKTRYLTGTWQGEGAYADTSCFPGEELLIALQQIPKSDYPLEVFVARKFLNYFSRPRKQAQADSAKPARPLLVDVEPSVAPDAGKPGVDFPAARKLDIQDVIAASDTVARIRLYDNASVDNDTVTIFVNKQAVLKRHRLTEQPWQFNLPISRTEPTEIILQAENLGEIPPNTALMVLEIGQRSYEIRLSATLESHAVLVIEPFR
jgi:hypothetical protein